MRLWPVPNRWTRPPSPMARAQIAAASSSAAPWVRSSFSSSAMAARVQPVAAPSPPTCLDMVETISWSHGAVNEHPQDRTDPLPGEAELCERFSVSRMTVRQALQELTNDGLVERRRGQGTFVAHRPVHRRPGVFLSFTEEMNRRGVQATSRLLSAGLDDPPPSETPHPRLAPHSQVVRGVRGRLAR